MAVIKLQFIIQVDTFSSGIGRYFGAGEGEKNKSSAVSLNVTIETRGLQNRESTSNECTVCFGSYDDDLSSDGTLLREWVQCTNNECQKWMHEDCVARGNSCLVCAVCRTEFK